MSAFFHRKDEPVRFDSAARDTIVDTWNHGEHYDKYIGRWSRRMAARFLAWLNEPAGQCWVDMGCGTGALASAITAQCAPRHVVGFDPSPRFLQIARKRLNGKVSFVRSAAGALPLQSGTVDVVAAGLVLNFVPDAPAAVRDMKRLLRPGGTVAAYVWDYAEGMQLIRFFWDAAVALDPDAARLDEGRRFPLCHPEKLRQVFTHAGLESIQLEAIDIATPLEGFEDYWSPFLGGQGPAPAYVVSLTEEARETLRRHLQERLPRAADGTIPLTARAWAIKASMPSA